MGRMVWTAFYWKISIKPFDLKNFNLDFEEIPSERLVPGDLIEIESQQASVMSCDAVLLQGNCILNESMLTGILSLH